MKEEQLGKEIRRDAKFLSKEYDISLDKAILIVHANMGAPSMTLQEIGDALNITRERVRQIEASGLKKLKHPMIGRKLKQYQHD